MLRGIHARCAARRLARACLLVLAILGTGVDGRLSPTSLDIPGRRPRRPTASCANTSATRPRSRSCCAARPPPSTARAPNWSAPCAPPTRRSRPSRPGTEARSGRCGPAPTGRWSSPTSTSDLPHAVNDSVDELNGILERQIHPPVNAIQTSYATLSREIQDKSIDAAERSELIALPILLHRPPARLPLAGRGGDPARLRRGHGRRLARPALRPHRLVRHRRLRADRLHDDGPGARGGLRPADGLPLPRGARRRGRPARGGGDDPPHRRAHHGLRRQHPAALDAGRVLRRPRLAARLAGGDRGPGGRAQRPRRDRRRPGGARPARAEPRPLADRRRAPASAPRG